MPHNHPPVIVHWNDAWASHDGFTKEAADDFKPVLMEEIGFLISDTVDGVTTCVSLMTCDGSLRHPNFIPRGMIVKIEYLRTVPADTLP